ncbi:MAG: hypothetical protein Q8R11_01500 [bacterium]|nr:hypothetical protein [bacterium]
MKTRSPFQYPIVTEAIIVVVIIAVLAATVLIVLNPFELSKKRRDTIRQSDLENIIAAIDRAVVDSFTGTASALFVGDVGSSLDKDASRGDGYGWVKVNLQAYLPQLPVDPINDATFHYEFGYRAGRFEIRGRLESDERQFALYKNDGGDDLDWMEFGTDLTIL